MQTFSLFRTGRGTRVALAIALSGTLAACAPNGSAGRSLADNSGNAIGCESFQQTFWDEMDQIALDDRQYPTEDAMRAEFDRALAEGRLSKLSTADRDRLSEALTDLYRTLTVDAVRDLRVNAGAKEEILGLITSVAIGDRTTPEKSALQDTVVAKFQAIERLAKSVDTTELPACSGATPPSGGTTPPTTGASPSPGSPKATPTPAPSTQFSQWKATRHPAVYGGLKTFATSYQSCEVGSSRALDKGVPNVQGIVIVGTASDGIGSLREIRDVNALVRSHPYLSSYTKPKTSCYDVTANPLIYDYGGRPLVTSVGTFDFFKNSGGTKVLGTDCSGYVYMALATAGLRIKTSTKMKASTIYGITSRLFVEPQSNGLTCLDHAKFKGRDTLRPGDIVAKPGHVFLIETVGQDPFGIAGITRVEDCKLENMSHERFDFTILQSSPSKEGIGIHRAAIKDYIPESPQMLAGLLDHAVNACKAKFSTASTTSRSSSAANTSIVRHSGSTACKDAQIVMERESCVSSCPARL